MSPLKINRRLGSEDLDANGHKPTRAVRALNRSQIPGKRSIAHEDAIARMKIRRFVIGG